MAKPTTRIKEPTNKHKIVNKTSIRNQEENLQTFNFEMWCSEVSII